MQCTRKVTEDVIWVGCNDRRTELFEHIFPIPRGVSYNSYLILDEKTVLMDTVDAAAGEQFQENVKYALGGRELDYLVVHHMEPDHCSYIAYLMKEYPNLKVVGSAKAIQMIGQFFDIDLEGRTIAVKEGDILETGKHVFRFMAAPMVHWPEVLVSYDETEKLLFTADAFGTFGALNGALFNDEFDFDKEWMADARRYYANIVGKYGMQVQNLLKKVATLDVAMICPLHGPVWRTDLSVFIDKYDKWSKYEPEEKAVAVFFGSIYGHTEEAVNALTCRLAEKGVRNIAVYDVSTTHVSTLIAEAFRCSNIVIACPTYNGGIFPPVEALLNDMKNLTVRNRTVALMDNGTWAPAAGKMIEKALLEMKNITILDEKISMKSTLKQDREAELEALADSIVASMA